MSKYQKIKPSQTTIDPRYQRDFDEPRARSMSKRFERNLVGVPVLSKRAEGVYVRIDGQHRLAAAEMAGLGDEPFLCEVMEGLSVQEEAELFLRLNGGRTAVRTFDKFKARQVAREPVSLAIVDTMKSLGLKIVKTPQKRGVCAIKAIEFVYHRGNLDATLRVLNEWADGDADSYEGQLIKAMSSFLIEYPDVEPTIMARKLQSFAPSKVLAKLKRTRGGMDCKPHEAACIVFREIYNIGRSKWLALPPMGQQATMQ